MAFRQIYLHFVWATHKRSALSAQACAFVEASVLSISEDLGIRTIAISVPIDHVHVLVEWKVNLTIADVVHPWKARTSYEWNRENEERMEWQSGYGVLSVSKKDVGTIAEYVFRQDEHHALGTLDETLEQTQ